MRAVLGQIVVVEDDASLRRVMRVVLVAHGFEVIAAATGTAALGLVRAHPDVVVVDLGLPDIDGTELIAKFRAATSARVLAVSAGDAHLAGRVATSAGADGFLAKPFGTDELVGILQALVAKAGSADETCGCGE